MFFTQHEVGWPGLIALSIGMFAFAVALFAARRRGARAPVDSGGRRDPASIAWIALQGVGIFMASSGRVHFASDRWSPVAWGSGAAVLVLMLAAVALFRWSTRTMGRNWALVARTRGDATLVTTGPFAYVRNPIYVALGLFMVGLSIASGNEMRLFLAAPIFAIGTFLRVRLEERVLRAEFCSAYDDYASRVRRFVPGLV